MTREELFFTHIEHIGEQQVPVKEEFKAGGTVRKSPAESATSVQEGTVAYGSDGAFYFTKKDKNGVQRWQKIAGTDGALNGLKVFSYDQILTGKKGDYDGIAYQRFFLRDTAQVPLAYIVYRLDSNNTKFELLNSPVNRTLVDNDSPFWSSSTVVEKEIFDFATTKLATTAAKILAKNIVSDIDYLDTLYRKIDNEIRESMDSNIGLIFDLSIIDNYRWGNGLSKLTPTQPASTTASTSHKFQVGDKVVIVDIGELYPDWTEKFDLLDFDSPNTKHAFGDNGDQAIVFTTSSDGTKNIYGVKIIKGRDLGAQILIGESGLMPKPIQVDLNQENIKIEVNNEQEAKAFQEWAFSKGVVWYGSKQPELANLDKKYFFIQEKELFMTNDTSAFVDEEGFRVTLEDLGISVPTVEEPKTETSIATKGVGATGKKPKSKKTNDDILVVDDYSVLPDKSIQEMEKEYDDLMFLISMTSPIDVVALMKLKQSAKDLKDKINALLMVEKDKMLAENNIFDELFTASTIQPKHRYNLKPYIDGFAPDGTATKLPPKVYDLTLTDDFENWFGDFQMAYQFKNSKYREVPCSIVKNEHYEPQIVFHGTGSVFSFFDFNKFPAMYFAENYHYAEWFASQKGAQEGHEGYVYPFLLNIRNPLDLTLFGINKVSPQEFMDYVYLQCGLKENDLKINPAMISAKNQKFEAWVYLRNSPEMLKVFRDTKLFDGIVYYEQNPPIDPSANNYKTKGFIIFEANNAKLVDPERHDLLLGNMRSFYLKKGGKL